MVSKMYLRLKRPRIRRELAETFSGPVMIRACASPNRLGRSAISHKDLHGDLTPPFEEEVGLCESMRI